MKEFILKFHFCVPTVRDGLLSLHLSFAHTSGFKLLLMNAVYSICVNFSEDIFHTH